MAEKSLIKEANETVNAFIQTLDALDTPEKKLQSMLSYMQKELAHGKLQPISRFWVMREFCLQQFKQDLFLSARMQLWEKYRQIVQELSKMKQLIKEKVASDQAEIIQALETLHDEIHKLSAQVKKAPSIDVPQDIPCIKKNATFYQSHQKELNVVSAYAKQLNGLKNELVTLDIHYRDKHALLEKLHELSDLVFPRKRELLGIISKQYTEDVQAFIHANFEKKELKFPVYELKEQIKSLQAFAKILSLNISSFSSTREKLSQSWDHIRAFEKQQKKLKEQQKAACSENETRLKERIQKLKDEKVKLSSQDFEREVHQINESIKSIDLLKPQRKKLKEHLQLIDDTKISKDEFSEEDEIYLNLQRELITLEEKAKHWDYFSLMNEYERVLQVYESSKILDAQQNKILRGFGALKKELLEKLLEEVENSVNIEDLAEQIESFKALLRQDAEKFRRSLNASNQSIEKAMLYNELLTQTKQQLTDFEKKVKPSFSS